jgi:hypothetical protein
MLKLTITVFAGALALASVPALAVDLPDSGSKNFSPSGDTPAYFANESVPVAARTADASERDWSDVDAIAPAHSSFGSVRSGHRYGGRHHRYAYAHAAARHAVGRPGGATHSARFVRAVWASHAGAGRSPSARHGRPGARHAAAAAHPGA